MTTKPQAIQPIHGPARIIFEHGEPHGIRDDNGFLCFLHPVTKYPCQEDRYKKELAERRAAAELIVAALNNEQPAFSAVASYRVNNFCWWKRIDLKAGTVEWRQGILHAWSTDFEEFESGPAPYPVAVVEDTLTHAVHSVPVHLVNFSCEKPYSFPGLCDEVSFLAIKHSGDSFYTWYAKLEPSPVSPMAPCMTETTYRATGRTIRRDDGAEAEIYVEEPANG